MSRLPTELQQVKPGLNYLVPSPWIEEFLALNSNTDPGNLQFPQFDSTAYVDSFLSEFQADIIQELTHKCNYVPFQKIVMNPQPSSSIVWKVIPPLLWKMIEKRQKVRPVYTYCVSNNPPISEVFPVQQVQIVFCSKVETNVFIGFMPKTAPMISLVRELGFELGYVQVQESKITFPDSNREKSHYYSELEGIKLGNCMDSIIMAFNLEKHQSKSNFEIQVEQQLNESNEAVAGDLLSNMHEGASRHHMGQVNDGTMSTGAETLFSFNGDSPYHAHREYRMSEVFRNKNPEEIAIMKANVKQAVQGELIEVPSNNAEAMGQELEQLASEILETINFHKKKCKQLENDDL